MEISLDKLDVGQKCRVLRVENRGMTRKALLEMGIIPNTEITTVRSAPLGDPLEFLIQGYYLSVRKKDAAMVIVEVIPE